MLGTAADRLQKAHEAQLRQSQAAEAQAKALQMHATRAENLQRSLELFSGMRILPLFEQTVRVEVT